MAVEEVPSVVIEAARQRQLGQLVIAQRAPTRRGDLIRALAFFGIGSLVLGAMLYGAGMIWSATFLGVLALPCLVLGVVLLIYAVRVSLQRAQQYYLYAGGLVHHKGRRLHAIAWSEIARLTRRRVNVEAMSRVSMKPDDVGVKADSVIGYELALRGGGKLFLEVGNVAEDQARFCAPNWNTSAPRPTSPSPVETPDNARTEGGPQPGSPEQGAAVRSRCGGQRYAFNWGLALVKAI